MGNPLKTGFRLLTSGNWSHAAARLKDRWRRRKLRRGQPFIYKRLGSRYVVIPGSPASEASYLDEPEETREIAAWRTWIEPGDTVIDGGAHTGLYALPAAEIVGPRGIVVAVDADETLVDVIRQAATMLGYSQSCRLVTAALGDRDGLTEFFFSATPDANAVMQSLQRPGSNFVSRQVPMQSLSSLASAQFKGVLPAAIKLDLEGAEQLALSAAPKDWFSENGPLWLIELNAEALARFKCQPGDILSLFPATTHTCRVISHYPHAGHKSAAVSSLSPPPAWNSAVYFNLIAIPHGQKSARRRHRLKALLA